jgi:hypothetical protein
MSFWVGLLLSRVKVDVDKDWQGYRITNLGAPVNPTDALRLAELASHKGASPIDHPDLSVTTQKLADGSVTTQKLNTSVLTFIMVV